MTLDRYGHLYEDEQDAVADRRDRVDASGKITPRYNGRLYTSASAEPTPEPA